MSVGRFGDAGLHVSGFRRLGLVACSMGLLFRGSGLQGFTTTGLDQGLSVFVWACRADTLI